MSQSPVPNLTSALKPLALEMQRGCRDDAVVGGLGPYMAGWARQGARIAEPELARRLERIASAFDSYTSLDTGQRGALCEKTRRALELYRTRYVTTAAPDRISEASPVRFLKGVGPKREEALANLGVRTVGDLLRHYPIRHDDRRHLPPLADLQHRQPATVRVTVTGLGEVRRIGLRDVARVPVTDGATAGHLIWFGQPYRAEQYAPGTALVATGQTMIHRGEVSLVVSEVEVLGGSEDDSQLSVGKIVPVYPLTSGLTQRVLRRLVSQALRVCDPPPVSAVPADLAVARELGPLGDALGELHFPSCEQTRQAARKRVAYEELLRLQAALARRKREASAEMAGAQVPADGLLAEFAGALPFEPTGAQRRVMAEIAADLQRLAAAHRLIHGDVGSGKTVCAAFALFAAARAGRQAALMAPTELLAEQHHRTVDSLLRPLGVRCRMLVGGMSETDKRQVRQGVAEGSIPVIVGTHALFQESVRFRDLAVAVVDEQHRFGVRQRAELSAKGTRPNVFVMSATPIPRTLALTAYGDFDVSVVDELPPGRTPVLTTLAWGKERMRAYETLAAHVLRGRQGYIVCPLVEHGDDDKLAAAEHEVRRLQVGLLASFKLGLVHGQMDAEQRHRVMEQFRRGEIEILVTTTVIEVGVDVPNATVMLIENSERFGLAQLHQLRGRVGRGEHESICILLTRAKTPEVIARLQVLERTNDGFEIAEEDLARRGPGEMTGTRQSGLPDLRMADLVADTQTLAMAREDAFALVAQDPDLRKPEHRALRAALSQYESTPGQWAI